MPVSVPVGDGPVEHVDVRHGEYHDSVTLMLAGRAVAKVGGVERVLVAMATELNVALLDELGYAPLDDAGPGDLIVAFTCDSTTSESAALDALSDSLSPRPTSAQAGAQPGGSITAPGHPHADQQLPGPLPLPLPRTTATALGRTSAPITLISTPGLASITEAMESLEYGANPIIFSDNIPIEHEVRLKEAARRRGLLVMGPDCGTVVLQGTGLAFANITNPGPISLVAASGTGAQELLALLDAAGTGIRHCLGVGGRDLTVQVAGRSTLAAMTALAEDAETELIAVVSKPPHPTIATRIEAHAATLGKQVHFAFVSPDHPTLTEAAERILTTLGRQAPRAWPRWTPAATPSTDTSTSTSTSTRTNTSTPSASPTTPTPPTPTPSTPTSPTPTPSTPTSPTPTAMATPAHQTTPSAAPQPSEEDTTAAPHRAAMIRGLFSGGTLRAEAEIVLTRAGGQIFDNEKAGGRGEGESRRLPTSPAPFTHHLTDFGDDAYTRGRPHPMIDNTLRLRALADAAEDAGVGVVLLDVVLGRGAHPDPAGEVGPAVRAALARRPAVAVVVSLCGTGGDPQGLVRQAETLAAAGAWVFLSNAEAAEAAARLALGGLPGGDEGR